jgi:hypothetical protein
VSLLTGPSNNAGRPPARLPLKINRPRSDSGKRSPLERLILETVTYQPVKARELAARTGARLGSPFRRALMQLHRAGVLEYDRRRGWRLAEVAEE